MEDLKNPKNCAIWVVELNEKTQKYELVTELETYNNLPKYNDLLKD